MKFPVFGAFLFKDLVFDRGRSLLTIISLTAVIVSYLAASATSEVFLEFGSQQQTGSRNLLIMSDYALDPMQSKLDDSILQTAAEIVRQEFGPDSVRSVFPVIYRILEINDRTMQVLAVPRENLISGYSLVLQEGDWPSNEEQVVVTQEAMQLNGWKIGDRILIRDGNFLITGRVQEEAARTSAIWMTYAGGQKLFNVQSVFQIGVLQINDSLDLTTIQASLEQDPHFPIGYAVYLNQQLYGRYTYLFRDFLKVSFILAALALTVVILGTFNAASLTMAERKQDIAILQTIGFGSRTIRLFLLGRTLLQTLVAFFLAWGVMAIIVIKSQKFPLAFHANTAVLRLSPEILFLGFLLTMLSASLGVWLTPQAQISQTLADQLRK
jgi:ABC-type antimicrobial peptide transport system permease subunit